MLINQPNSQEYSRKSSTDHSCTVKAAKDPEHNPEEQKKPPQLSHWAHQRPQPSNSSKFINLVNTKTSYRKK